jgi:hypothetical protein
MILASTKSPSKDCERVARGDMRPRSAGRPGSQRASLHLKGAAILWRECGLPSISESKERQEPNRPTLESTDFRRLSANLPKPGRTSSVPLRSVRLGRHSNSQPFERLSGLGPAQSVDVKSSNSSYWLLWPIIWTFITMVVSNYLDDHSTVALMRDSGSRVTSAHRSFVRPPTTEAGL